MKFLIFVGSILAVVYCVSSDNDQYDYDKYDSGEVEDQDYRTVETSTLVSILGPQRLPSAPDSSLRVRRSPPRFDPNKMKGKFAKGFREKRNADVGEFFKRIHDRTSETKARYIAEHKEPLPSTSRIPQTTISA